MAITLPLTSQAYTLEDLTDDDRLVADDDTLEIDVHEMIENEYFSDKLTIDAFSDTFNAVLGDFDVGEIPAGRISLTLGELWDEAPEVPTLIRLEPLCFQDNDWISKGVYLGDDFEWIELESGILTLRIENDLPFSLGNPENGCPLILRVTSGTYEYEWSIDESIAPGESLTLTSDLGGKTIENDVMVLLKAGTPGTANEVLLSRDDSLCVEVSLSEISARRAFARIASQNISSTDSIVIEDSSRIVWGEISSGELELHFLNDLPTSVGLCLESGNISLNGSPFDLTQDLGPDEEKVVTIDLAGYEIETQILGEDPWEGSNKLTFTVLVSIDSTEAPCEVSSDDGIGIVVSLRSLTFNSLMGKIKPTEIDFARTVEVSFPEAAEHIEPERAILRLEIMNTSPLAGQFHLDLEAERDGILRWAKITGEIQPNSERGSQALTTCEFQNSEITGLVSLFPEEIRIEGKVIVSGEGAVSSDDFIGGSVEVIVPLVFRIKPGLVRPVPRRIEIDKEIREAIEDGLTGAVLQGKLITSAQLQGTWRILIGLDSTSVYSSPALVLPKEGTVDLPNEGDSLRVSNLELELSENDLGTFLNPCIWLGLEIDFSGSEGTVALTRYDFAQFTGILKAIRRIGQ